MSEEQPVHEINQNATQQQVKTETQKEQSENKPLNIDTNTQEPTSPRIERTEVLEVNQNSTQQQVKPQVQQEVSKKKSLTIDTNIQEPTSPRSEQTEEITSQPILSPRGQNSQKIISQQSPKILKGKMEVLKKLYNQHLEKLALLKEVEQSFESKKQQLSQLNEQLSNSQKNVTQNIGEASKLVAQKQLKLAQLEQRLNNLKSENLEGAHTEKVTRLKVGIENAEMRIQQRQATARENFLASKVSERVNSLKKTVEGLENRKKETEFLNNANRSRIIETRSNLDSLLNKLLQTTSGNSSLKLTELESQHKNVDQQISHRISQINRLKTQLQNVKKTEVSSVQTPDLTSLRAQVEEAKKNKAQLQKAIQTHQKESKDVASKIKSEQSAINSRKSKNAQLNEKTKKLEAEKNSLEKEINEGQKKKPKFQEKVPEQLLQLRVLKTALEKQVRENVQKVDKQRKKQDNLVPASVLEVMRGKINKLTEQNQLYKQLVVNNSTLKQQNIKLDAKKEELQWQSNPQIKNAEVARQKEEQKHDALEEEVNDLRKKNIHITTKLEEYVNQYPDFKPEKKIKKPEPSPQQKQPQQTKKEPAPQQLAKKEQTVEKAAKKKKNTNKSNPEIPQVVVPEVEEELPVITEKPVQKKQEQKAGKGKNKSSKNKQTEQSQQAKQEPKKQEPKKQEVPKKQQVQKKEELKTEIKASQSGQSNKNKKKR